MGLIILVKMNFYSHLNLKNKLWKRERGRRTRAQTEPFWVLLLLLPNTQNSCLNFPLSCVSIVLWRGGNWPLRVCGDSCLLHSFSCERQQSYLFYKGLVERCAVQLLWGKQWEGPLWYFVVAIKLSYCSRYRINKLNSPMTGGAYSTQENKHTKHTHTDLHTHTHGVNHLPKLKSCWDFKRPIRT